MSSRLSKRKQRKEEDARRKAAREAGAFWLPCPLCDQPFGGNEVYLDSTKSPWIEHQDLEGYGQLICPRCSEAGLGDPKFIQLFSETPPPAPEPKCSNCFDREIGCLECVDNSKDVR